VAILIEALVLLFSKTSQSLEIIINGIEILKKYAERGMKEKEKIPWDKEAISWFRTLLDSNVGIKITVDGIESDIDTTYADHDYRVEYLVKDPTILEAAELEEPVTIGWNPKKEDVSFLEKLLEKLKKWNEDFIYILNRNEELRWEIREGRYKTLERVLQEMGEHPFEGIPLGKMNEGSGYTDVTDMEHTGGGAAIDPAVAIIMNSVMSALPGAVNTAFENNVPVALENAVQSVIGKTAEETGIGTLATGEESQNLLLNIEEMKNMLAQMASQNSDEGLADAIATKILEKTGGVVGGEGQMAKEEMVATMVEGMEELPEQHKEILGIVERNQTLIYSYKDQLLRLEHMIQTKAMTIDQIYKKIVKKMWDEYRCGG
jgi:hypothetical protein